MSSSRITPIRDFFEDDAFYYIIVKHDASSMALADYVIEQGGKLSE